jgi:eukaryotic-like serine/threonine-protein kinase
MPARTCPFCGAELNAGVLGGLCPKCVLKNVVVDPEGRGHKPEVKEPEQAVGVGAPECPALDLKPVPPPPEPGKESSTGSAPPFVTEEPGDRIGRYKLLQRLGEGGMGSVWMAEQTEPVRRLVALKVIKPGMDSAEVLARFEAERQALALMDHPNIARVFDAGATPSGRPFFVMELVKGIRLTSFCDEQRLSVPERLDLFVQVCQAVQHAHQKGIIHRDLKPGNVMVALYDGKPVPKVIDFGVAKAAGPRLTERTLYTQIGSVVGTLEYMSPEQAELNQLDIDTRSDIYSLGVLLYEMLTGTTPLTREALRQGAFEEVLRRIREEEPPRPSLRLSTNRERLPSISAQRKLDPERLTKAVRGDLDWIVIKALEKDRGRRYETADGLAQDINRHLSHEPVGARPPSRIYRFRKLVRRNRTVFAAAAAVTVSLLIGLSLSTVLFFRERAARQRAVMAEQSQAKLRLRAEGNEKIARTEAQKSAHVAAFLKDMLGGVEPSAARGRDTTMLREILDRTALRAGQDLKEEPEVEAEIRNTLGEVYYALGEFQRGEEMESAALALWRQVFGNEHPQVATALNNLGEILRYRGDYSRAEAVHREALAIRRKLQGDEDEQTAKSLNNLGIALEKQDKLAEAEHCHREALGIQMKVLGSDHPQVATSLNNLSLVLTEEGKLDEAVEFSRRAVALRRRVLGGDHPGVASSLNNLAMALERQSNFVAAAEALREALALRRKVLPPDHPGVAVSIGNLAAVLMKMNQLSDAETLAREALELARKRYGDGRWEVSDALANLADLLLRQKKFAEAEPFARECLTIRVRLRPEAWRSSFARALLGASLLGQKRPADAEPLLLTAAEGIKQGAKLPPAQVKQTLESLVELYEAMNSKTKAGEWKRKLEEFEAGLRGDRAESEPRTE